MNSKLEQDRPVSGISNLDFQGVHFRSMLLLTQKSNMVMPSHRHAVHQNTKMSHPICRAALKHPPHRGCSNTLEIAGTLLRMSPQDWLKSGARSGLRAPRRRSAPNKQDVGLAPACDRQVQVPACCLISLPSSSYKWKTNAF